MLGGRTESSGWAGKALAGKAAKRRAGIASFFSARGSAWVAAVAPVAQGASQVAQSSQQQESFWGLFTIVDTSIGAAGASTAVAIFMHGGAPNAAAVAGSGIEIASKAISMARISLI